jgi:hypothetical protein
MAWKMINMIVNCCNRKYYNHSIANKSTQEYHPIFEVQEIEAFLNFEEEANRLPQNFGKELPLHAA